MKKLLLITPVLALLAGCSLQQNTTINQEPLTQTGTEISTGIEIVQNNEIKETLIGNTNNERSLFDLPEFGIRFSLQKQYESMKGKFEIINKVEVNGNIIQTLTKDTANPEEGFGKGPTITLISLSEGQTAEGYVSSQIKEEVKELCSVNVNTDKNTRIGFGLTEKGIKKAGAPSPSVDDVCNVSANERYVYNPNFPKKLFKVTGLGVQSDDAPGFGQSIEIYK